MNVFEFSRITCNITATVVVSNAESLLALLDEDGTETVMKTAVCLKIDHSMTACFIIRSHSAKINLAFLLSWMSKSI